MEKLSYGNRHMPAGYKQPLAAHRIDGLLYLRYQTPMVTGPFTEPEGQVLIGLVCTSPAFRTCPVRRSVQEWTEEPANRPGAGDAVEVTRRLNSKPAIKTRPREQDSDQREEANAEGDQLT